MDLLGMLTGKSFAAGDPLDERYYGGSWFGGRETSAGESVSEDSAMTYSAAFAATVLLSSAGSCLPVDVYRKQGGKREVQDGHPVQDLLRFEPNEESTPVGWSMRSFIEQINWSPGSISEIERNALGEPVALWPVHPSRVEYDHKTGNRLMYRIRDEGSSTVRDFRPDQVLHTHGKYCFDGIGSIGVITFARESIGKGKASDRHEASQYKNGMSPQFAIKMNGSKLTPETRENLRRDLESKYAGAGNAFRPILLDQTMELQSVAFNHRDAQFLESNQMTVEDVARFYGVPPHLIGHLLRSTFNNIETQGIEFVIYSLMPWLVCREQQMNKKLLTQEERKAGFYVKYNVNALMRGDSAARAAFYNAMRQMGAMSANEIREKEDMNPVPGGDRYLVPLNMADQETGEAFGQSSEPEPDSPPSTPSPDNDSGTRETPTPNDALRSAARIALTAALHHVTDLEIRAAVKASADSKRFLEWLPGFYGGHADTCEKHLAPSVDVARKAGCDLPPDYIQVRNGGHREQLEAVYDTAQPADFQAQIKSTVYGWRDSIESEVADVFA